MELCIDMVKKADGASIAWAHQNFSVAGAGDKYRLSIGGKEMAVAIHNGRAQ